VPSRAGLPATSKAAGSRSRRANPRYGKGFPVTWIIGGLFSRALL
jgi:hypothetical protein